MKTLHIKRCEVCGGPADPQSRCTNARCVGCHSQHCTPGGIDSPGHARGKVRTHEFDEDACCKRCGFDGAEHWHLNRYLPKDQRDPTPPCRSINE